MRLCLACGRTLPALARPNRRYCNSACRLLAFRQRHGSGTIRHTVLDRLASAGGALSEPRLLAGIQEAAQHDWQAAAWVLSRRWPQRWGPAAGRVAREPDELEALR
jgi:hypothetical protein